VIFDEKEGVSARNSFGAGDGSRPNSLAQSSELVGLGSVPSCLVAGSGMHSGQSRCSYLSVDLR
jgi:hypothetical protein